MPRGKKNPPPDGVVDVPLPLKGLDVQTALEYQPAGTSPDLQNVRGQRPDNAREGLCQRSGIQKYCPDQLDGETTPVQEIIKVVVEDGQAQPFGPGISYVPVGTDIYVIDTDGNVALVYPAPGGRTAGPGFFDTQGNLTQQNTSSTSFHTRRHNTAPQPDPVNARRWPPFNARRFNPQPVIRLNPDRVIGGINPQGQNQRLRDDRNQQFDDEGNVDGDDGFQAIRDMDQFPAAPGNGPEEWLGQGDLPGGGS